MTNIIISRNVTYKSIKAHRICSLNKNWQSTHTKPKLYFQAFIIKGWRWRVQNRWRV